MDPCECVDMFNTQVLIGHILNLVNSQTECTDSQCFTPSDVGGQLSSRIDPSASFSSIIVALIAMLVLVLMLPMNVRRRRNGGQASEQMLKEKGKRPSDDPDHDGNGPDMAL